jgi:hypothetical protein
MWFAVQMLPAPPSWLMNESGTKLLVILAAMIALFMVGRWISARAESSAHDPTLIQHETPSVRPTVVQEPNDPSPDPNAPVHPEMDFGPVVLRKLYFGGFDTASGPADPLSFVDDVTVEVYFKQTGSLYENTYTIATPTGLSQLLRDKEWDILYSPEIFIVNRYDLKLIRETVMDHLMDVSELRQAPAASDGVERFMG